MGLQIIILAAGHGKRMHSTLSKVLHPLAGQPLLGHVLQTAMSLRPDQVVVVTAPERQDVQAYLKTQPYGAVEIAYQSPPQGTGHAVQCAESLTPASIDRTLILYGDVPLLQAETLEKVLAAQTPEVTAVVLGMESADQQNYGRLVTDPKQPYHLERIVEIKDATPAEQAITLCNSGVMCVATHALFAYLKQVPKNPQTGEYYLTDVIGLARGQGGTCHVIVGPEAELTGINNRVDLAAAEGAWQRRYRQRIMESGVTLTDPASVFFAYDTHVEPDVVIGPSVVFGPGVHIETQAQIHSFCHIEGTHIAQGVQVGPFARLRPKTTLHPGAEVGNFVEIKNMDVGQRAKVKHLSYVADGTVGIDSNIGAGTITANYDGFNKWRTTIGDGVMIGSNSVLVAPLQVGDGALVAAGSVITEDVPPGDLAITRGPLAKRPGGALKLREKYRAIKLKKQSPTRSEA